MDNNSIENAEGHPHDHKKKDNTKVGCHRTKKILIRKWVSNTGFYPKLRRREEETVITR